MSTIKSSAENLTLNADGANNDIKFQSNGSEVASIDQAGVLVSSGGSTHADNVKAKFGTDNDLEIYHDGSDSIIHDTGTGDLYLKGSAEVLIRSATNENMIKAVANAQVNLYYDNALKLATSSTGVNVTGGVTVTGGVAIGGTGAANTLDDYEEGTCNMGMTASSGGQSVSFANTTGHYTKVGNVCTVGWYTGSSTVSNAGSGVIQITGIPFTAKSGGSHFAIAHWVHSNGGSNSFFGSNSSGGYIEGGTTTLWPVADHSTAGTGFATGNPKFLMMSITYLTS